MRPVVLSLCDRTGVMVEPWAEAGYDCITVDLQPSANESPNWTHFVADVRTWLPPLLEYGIIFAFPPCTHLANSGARWFRDKGLSKLIEGLELVEACRRICEWSDAPWMIENPVGQLSSYWRAPDLMFDPYHFAGYCDDPTEDSYTKRTCLWVGHGFRIPPKRPWGSTLQGSKMHLMAPSPERGDLRSVTPRGFARAVFEANVEREGVA